jgi:2-polyprenyl-3-methyl-5-hydroxy-6-metoxy-1,4-benzoquinol methylase
MKQYHEENRLSWNAATIAHNSHKGDQAQFFRADGNKLHNEEKELLGEITGSTIVHLQCNSGQDTLSLAQMGAIVTGIDISDTAIEFARQLSADSGVAATFVRMDVYDWLKQAGETGQQFDIAFCSYGAICWLSDLSTWAKGIAAILKPGGRFVTVDYHPVMNLFDEHLQRKFSYFAAGTPLTWEEGVGDYVALTGRGLPGSEFIEGIQNFKNPHKVHEFQWGIAEIVTALLEAGLTLNTLKEYPYTNGFRPFDEMYESERRWYLPKGMPDLPLMYAIAARKPEQG